MFKKILKKYFLLTQYGTKNYNDTNKFWNKFKRSDFFVII